MSSIAIIGLAGRFPGAPNIDAFWANLVNGVESVSSFTDAELTATGIEPGLVRDPTYVKARALLDGADLFDAGFFGYTPADAANMDPQQRVFLECVWEALEHAGYDSERHDGAIGLFAGHGLNSYLLANLCAGREWIDEFLDGRNVGSFQTFLGNDKDYLTSRVAFKLNLRGPAVTVQTACSTSLVAVSMACQSLLTHQSDMALAGGVSITFPEKKGYLYREGGITSPDGHCRAFDARAEGTVFGSGAGVVVLKRLADAIADGDQIYAVIRGSALNNDGSVKVSYTAPSVDGQAEVIVMAQTLAGVSPDTIGYIEAHGTGTPLGDPIELAALTQAFRIGTERRQFCALGSVKTNIGHLDAAAGIAGLIKTTLALHHKKLPPSLHFEQPNPQIDFAGSPFFVNTALTEWPSTVGAPRRAGVSSFGVGGTNAHVVLEEAPAAAPAGQTRPVHLLLLSARSEAALGQATLNLQKHLRDNPALNLADVAYTLQVGRRAFTHRRAFVCRDTLDAIAMLASPGDVPLTVGADNDEHAALLATLGRRWLAGEELDWTDFYAGNKRRRVPLPSYPFERKRHFVEPPRRSEVGQRACSRSENAPASGLPTPQALSPLDRIATELLVLFRELSGIELTDQHRAVPLIELGFDSLFLTQVRQSFESQFGVNITYRQLAESLNTVDALADYLAVHAEPGITLPALCSGRPPCLPIEECANGNSRQAGTPAATVEPKSLGPFRPLAKSISGPLTAPQQRWLTEFTARYTCRTATSKRLAIENRPGVADPRSLANYRPAWKELVYQIVVDESAGARLRDVDGNDYLDVTMGFGANLLGHSPAFVTEAITNQLRKGVHIGPQSPLTGEVAALIREFTGMERVTFCNTGSEAVMAALRVARTITRRTRIVYFAGDYHGLFDEVLMRPVQTDGAMRAVPIAPGIPVNAGADVLVLEYGTAASLETIRQLGPELAAVLVEPVQSRNPELQPREFLHELRRITQESGTVLIFDEVITGFRIHPGGAQAWFDVRADLATYGKVIGGGLPFGVLAGSARCMDALDGGPWNFGDDTGPEADITFFAGTFVRHPLALAAARATLRHLKERGGELQAGLNRRTTELATTLNAFFEEEALPIRVRHFGSLFRFDFPPELPHATLLVYAMLERGIYFRDAHQNCFLSTAHTEEDVACFIAGVRASVAELQEANFLPRREIAAPFALTDAQQEIWLACQWSADHSRAYNQSLALDLRGPLDLAALRAGWNELLHRHEALRLTISSDGETQQAAPPRTTDLPFADWSMLTEADRAAKVAEIADTEAAQAFDLEHGPLVRARVCRLAPEHHRFVFTAHHLVCDGWSVGVLFSELGQLYSAHRNRTPHALDRATPFLNFVRGEATRHSGTEFAAAERYWLDHFASLPPALELPADHPRRGETTPCGGTGRLVLAADLVADLKRVAARQQVSSFTLFVAAYQVFLRRLSGQEESVVGIVTSGQAGMDGGRTLVGHGVNLLPIRGRIASDAMFTSCLVETDRAILDARDHDRFSYGRLLQKLKLSRDGGRPPLMSALINIDPAGAGELTFDGLEVALEPNAKGFVNFDLFLNLRENGSDLVAELEYNRNLFEPATIRRWLGHFTVLLQGIVADPNRPASDLPLLSTDEREQLLVRWNATRRDYPRNATVPELFEEQVALRPEAIAVEFGEACITYHELNCRANQLAARLRTLGVGPDAPVPVCLERSVGLIVALLGILKAGGTYASLDPEYPPARLAFMLDDLGASVVLTQRSLLAKLPASAANVVCLDEVERVAPNALSSDGPQTSALGATRATSVTAESLAYISYTSGSTGQPKGVCITHRGVVRLVRGADYASFGPAETFLQLAPVGFDASTFEIWGALLNGARLVIYPPGTPSLAELGEFIADRRVTTLWLTAGLFHALVDHSLESFRHVRQLLAGGDTLSPTHVQKVLHAWPQCRLINGYGPTENTTFTCCHAITSADGAIPIGRPIANTEVYILDGARHPAPIGVPGELWVGGDGLARGYLNRPELTAEKFIPHPFQSGERLYRTGDRAQWRPDGGIDFLGRIDRQVKLRGFRVELEEIEAQLHRHPQVRACVVTVRTQDNGDQQLAAHVVPAGLAPPPGELRAYLQQCVPLHMVPATFEFIPELPLTANGKIDHRALRIREPVDRGQVRGLVAPMTAAGKTLARIWCEVLHMTEVNATDNFFSLGGHSLLAMRVAARVRNAFQVDLSMKQIFETPTLSALADLIEDLLLERIAGLSDEEALRDAATIGAK